MRRHIVCFGDSNTHGYCADPADCEDGGTRFSERERWTCLLQQKLGPDFLVLEEGLPGRTCVYDDPTEEGMRGLDYIVPCLMSHQPVDLLAVMLGTNDARACYGASPEQITRGMERLVRRAQAAPCWGAPGANILLIPPAPLPEAAERCAVSGPIMGPGCAEKTRALPELYRQAARRLGCACFDPTGLVEYNQVDYMHLTRADHDRLARALESEITRLV